MWACLSSLRIYLFEVLTQTIAVNCDCKPRLQTETTNRDCILRLYTETVNRDCKL